MQHDSGRVLLPMRTLSDAFQDNITSLTCGGPVPADPVDQVLGPELDELITDWGPWSSLKQANFELMRAIPPTRRVAVVATVKNEGAYLVEWVAHQRAIGFEHVFLYTNDNTDGSDALLAALSRTGFVTVIYNRTSRHVPPQGKAYEHSIHLLRDLRRYEWVAYLDADEFLIPTGKYDFHLLPLLAELRRLDPVGDIVTLAVNWQFFGSSGQVRRTEGLLMERFQHSQPCPLVKSMVRLSKVTAMRQVHVPEPEDALTVNSAFEPVRAQDCLVPPAALPGIQLNHYYGRSFEEFCLKQARGRGNVFGGLVGKGMETFFQWDVPATPANHTPPPPTLLARLQGEVECLMALPGIAAAWRATMQRTAQQSRHLIGDPEMRYAACHVRFALKDMLAGAPADAQCGALPVVR